MTYSNGHGGSAPHPMIPIEDRKRMARDEAKRRMAQADPALGVAAGERIRDAGLIPPGAVVAGFLPLGREIDISALLHALRVAGYIVALPRTPAVGLPLSFHRWGEADDLRRERFGTLTSEGPEVQPDVLLVPMLAFDQLCHRLGYGGGFYDRTLAARPGILTIGCAYAMQEMADLPVGPHDRRLGCIATEVGVIRPRAIA